MYLLNASFFIFPHSLPFLPPLSSLCTPSYPPPFLLHFPSRRTKPLPALSLTSKDPESPRAIVPFLSPFSRLWSFFFSLPPLPLLYHLLLLPDTFWLHFNPTSLQDRINTLIVPLAFGGSSIASFALTPEAKEMSEELAKRTKGFGTPLCHTTSMKYKVRRFWQINL